MYSADEDPHTKQFMLRGGYVFNNPQCAFMWVLDAGADTERLSRALDVDEAVSNVYDTSDTITLEWSEALVAARLHEREDFAETVQRAKHIRYKKRDDHAEKLRLIRRRWPETRHVDQHNALYIQEEKRFRTTKELNKLSVLAGRMTYPEYANALCRAYYHRVTRSVSIQHCAPQTIQKTSDIRNITKAIIDPDKRQSWVRPITDNERQSFLDAGFTPGEDGLPCPKSPPFLYHEYNGVGTLDFQHPTSFVSENSDIRNTNGKRTRSIDNVETYPTGEELSTPCANTVSDMEISSNALVADRVRDWQKRCACKDDADPHIKNILLQHQNDEQEYQETFDEVIKYLDQNYHGQYGPFCHYHLSAHLSSLGFYLNRATRQDLVDHMRFFAMVKDDGCFVDPDELRRCYPHCYRFTKQRRQVRPIDRRGNWRYDCDLASLLHVPLVPERVLEPFFPRAHQLFKDRGTVNVDAFTWWFQQDYSHSELGPIGDLFLEEAAMYKHHMHRHVNEPDLGWLYASFHMIGQQAMRMDPLYYLLYTCLRSDNAQNLISYPYYAKYTIPGSKTAFKHLDINPAKLATGPGRYMAQGSLSMTDENKDDCTVMVDGMHKWAEEWWADVVARGDHNESSGLVVDLTTTGLIRQEDREKYGGFEFVPHVLKRGQVRISQPSIGHGSTGPATTERITFLPWYVQVNDDGETLEVKESGTWSEISAAHRDLKPGPRTPSGLPLLWGAATTRFPANVLLTTDCAISDALVGRRRWSDPMVYYEKRVLFDYNNVEAAHMFIHDWRQKLVQRVGIAWKQLCDIEEALYGNSSYFRCKREHRLGKAAPCADDPDPSGPL